MLAGQSGALAKFTLRLIDVNILESLLGLWRRGRAVAAWLCTADLMALSDLLRSLPLGTLWPVDTEKLAKIDSTTRDLFIKVTKLEIAIDHLTTFFARLAELTGSIFVFLTPISGYIFLTLVWHQTLFDFVSLLFGLLFLHVHYFDWLITPSHESSARGRSGLP